MVDRDAEMKQMVEEVMSNGGKKLRKMRQSFETLSKQSFKKLSRKSFGTLSQKRKRGSREAEASSCKRLNKGCAEQEVDNNEKENGRDERKVKVANLVEDNEKENGGEERKVKVANLPVPVLEKVFSRLDWKDLGRAMMVCRRWEEVGGHPSLWTEFPLQLAVVNLNSCSKIRRLAWVKSVTIAFPKRDKHLEQKQKDKLETLERDFVLNVVTLFNRVEELIFLDELEYFNRRMSLADVFFMVQKVNKRVVRICAKRSLNVTENDGSLSSENEYFVTNCDASTNEFIKKTVEKNGRQMIESIDDHSGGRHIRITGPPGVQFSNEVLETIFTVYKYPITLSTSLMIGPNIDLVKLKHLLSRHVSGFVDWEMNAEDLEKQEAAPINTILDQLARWAHWDGCLDRVNLPRELVLKSHWLEKLGGRAMVEAGDAYGETNILSINSVRSGLKLAEFDGDVEINLDEDEE